jgi:hypothetical protein
MGITHEEQRRGQRQDATVDAMDVCFHRSIEADLWQWLLKTDST